MNVEKNIQDFFDFLYKKSLYKFRKTNKKYISIDLNKNEITPYFINDFEYLIHYLNEIKYKGEVFVISISYDIKNEKYTFILKKPYFFKKPL